MNCLPFCSLSGLFRCGFKIKRWHAALLQQPKDKIRAVNNNWLIDRKLRKMPILIFQSPMWCLQIAYFIWPTDQNSRILYNHIWQKRSMKSPHLRSWMQWMFGLFDEEWLTQWIIKWIKLIFHQPTNELINEPFQLQINLLCTGTGTKKQVSNWY